MKIIASCIFFALMMNVVYMETEPCLPCKKEWGVDRVLGYPNWNDCNTYYKCLNGVISLASCRSGEIFDFLMMTCVTKGAEMVSCQSIMNKVC